MRTIAECKRIIKEITKCNPYEDTYGWHWAIRLVKDRKTVGWIPPPKGKKYAQFGNGPKTFYSREQAANAAADFVERMKGEITP